MEIKILCACGAKYKFAVEPAGGTMPWSVNCPVCGADGTAQANAILRQQGMAAPAGMAPPTEIAPPPGSPVTAPSPPPLPRLVPPAPPAPRPSAPRAFVPATASKPDPEHRSKWATIALLLCVAVGVGLGAWKFGRKWYNRISAVVEVAQAIKDAGSDSSSAAHQFNLDFEDCVVLFVKATNHTIVAEACQDYWQSKQGRKLVLVETDAEVGIDDGEYELVPAYNGWVRLIGSLEWPAPQYEALSQHLSQKLGTVVFESSDVDFSGAYHFGVYDTGVRRFHAQMEIKIVNSDLSETVTTVGNDWALAHGFKPDEEGFDGFDLADADAITQNLGMKLWDEDLEKRTKSLIFREQGGAARPARQ